MLGGYGGKTTSLTLEREQSEEVLPSVVPVIMDISCCKKKWWNRVDYFFLALWQLFVKLLYMIFL